MPKPTYCRPTAGDPGRLRVEREPRPAAARLLVQGGQLVLVVGHEQRRPAAAGRSRRRPRPCCRSPRPRSSRATPAVSPTSSNAARRLAAVQVQEVVGRCRWPRRRPAGRRRPGPRRRTPEPLAVRRSFAQARLAALTSVKVPSPLLRYSGVRQRLEPAAAGRRRGGLAVVRAVGGWLVRTTSRRSGRRTGPGTRRRRGRPTRRCVLQSVSVSPAFAVTSTKRRPPLPSGSLWKRASRP